MFLPWMIDFLEFKACIYNVLKKKKSFYTGR